MRVLSAIVALSILFPVSMHTLTSCPAFCTCGFASDLDPGTLIVKMKTTKPPSSRLVKSSRVLFDSVYVVATDNLAQLEGELKIDAEVVYVERNRKAGKSTLPEVESALPEAEPPTFGKGMPKDGAPRSEVFDDPGVSRAWSFRDANEFGISVTRAYRDPINGVSERVVVAVVDTGIDFDHEDLREVVWTNSGEVAGNRIDDDGNGYVDDVHGINTLARDAHGVATGDVMASHPHGTHVAGIIAARQNNRLGITGIASNVRIMALRAIPDDGDEADVDVIEALLYAAKNGAKLINCSFGKQGTDDGAALADAIDHVGKTYGVLVFAAAGNDAVDVDVSPRYPASCKSDFVMAVAATTMDGSLYPKSNFGRLGVDVAAPGARIYSTVPGSKYAAMSGTSMAGPAVTGVAAEVLVHFPRLSPLQLKAVLMDSVTKVPELTDRVAAGGRIDLHGALRRANAAK